MSGVTRLALVLCLLAGLVAGVWWVRGIGTPSLGYTTDWPVRATDRIKGATSLRDLFFETWDEAFLFGPYTRACEIREAVATGYSTGRLASTDSVFLLVFLNDGHVVGEGTIPRGILLAPGVSGGKHVRIPGDDADEIFLRVREVPIDRGGAWRVADGAPLRVSTVVKGESFADCG